MNVVDGLGFPGALVSHATAEHTAEGTSAAEELGEEVLRIHSTRSGAAMFQTLLTILIIDLAFLRIRKDPICTRNLLEFLGCFWVACVLICLERSR